MTRTVTQPAANVLREIARHFEDERARCDDEALRDLAQAYGEPEGPGLRQRLARRIREFAEVVERGEL